LEELSESSVILAILLEQEIGSLNGKEKKEKSKFILLIADLFT